MNTMTNDVPRIGSRPTGLQSELTEKLLAKLREYQRGQVALYSDLSDCIGMPVQSDGRKKSAGYNALLSARRRLRDEDLISSEPATGIGIKLLADGIDKGARALKSMRRKARTIEKDVKCVEDFNSLPREKQARHNLLLASMGAIAQMTKPSRMKAIETKAVQSTALPSMDDTIAMFRDRDKRLGK